MPMKRSGRSVLAASRVIEIDDVLEAIERLRLQDRADVVEDLALDLFLLGRGLDHEIAIGETVERLAQRDAPHAPGCGRPR